jgi:hypothetical protein
LPAWHKAFEFFRHPGKYGLPCLRLSLPDEPKRRIGHANPDPPPCPWKSKEEALVRDVTIKHEWESQRKMHLPMKLSPKEETFLRHWIFDELHFQDRTLPRLAKKLQVKHSVAPAELADIIAAWMPSSEEQVQAAEGPPPSTAPEWPWSSREEFESLLAKARYDLRSRNRGPKP